MAASDSPSEQKAIRWYPPSYDIRVETVPVPQCEIFFPRFWVDLIFHHRSQDSTP